MEHFRQDCEGRQAFVKEMEEEKKVEFREHNFTSEGWTGKSGFIRNVLEEVALSRSFKSKRIISEEGMFGGFQKTTPAGTDFSTFYRTPPKGMELGQLQIAFLISRKENGYANIHLGNLEDVTKGLFSYATYVHTSGRGVPGSPQATIISPENAVLGVHVLVGVFDELYAMLSNAGV